MPSGDSPRLRAPADRESRRDRGPRHPGLRRAGDPVDRGLLRGRSRRPAHPPRRRSASSSGRRRPARATWRSRGSSRSPRASGAQAIHPGLRLPLREPVVRRGVRRGRPDVHRAVASGDAAAGRQGGGAPPGGRSTACRSSPATTAPTQDDRLLADEAARIGFPLLVKAAAGGGGRGMRVVTALSDLGEALAAARREAAAAFGDDTLILERLVVGARHVEVQVLGDGHGALIHLGERDCSVQRRHQKVIEESPAPGVTPELRSRARRGRRSGGTGGRLHRRRHLRVSAGRQRQLLVHRDERPPPGRAPGHRAGHRLRPRARPDRDRGRSAVALDARRTSSLRGHAVECRLYAEDPARDDLPSPGRLTRLQPPLGPGPAPRRRLRRRRRRAAVLRHDARQADRDRRGPRQRDRSGTRGARPVRRGRHPDEPGAARPGSWTIRRSRQGAPRPTSWRPRVPPASLTDAGPARGAGGGRRLGPDALPIASMAGSGLGDWRLGGQGVVTFWLPGATQRGRGRARRPRGSHDLAHHRRPGPGARRRRGPGGRAGHGSVCRRRRASVGRRRCAASVPAHGRWPAGPGWRPTGSGSAAPRRRALTGHRSGPGSRRRRERRRRRCPAGSSGSPSRSATRSPRTSRWSSSRR